MSRQNASDRCPEATEHQEGSRRDGRCTYCGAKFTDAASSPRLDGHRTGADREYRRHYDPDFGTDERDT